MDRERLNVAAPNLDDELRRLVAVTPSPEFEARVRARVAGMGIRRGVQGVWLSGSAMVAAAVMLAAVVLTPRRATDEPLRGTSFAPPIDAVRPSWSSTVVRSTPAVVNVAPPVTEVIVQRGQAAALLQFAALTAAGRIVDGSATQATIGSEAEDSLLQPVTIAPVTIELLAAAPPSGDPK